MKTDEAVIAAETPTLLELEPGKYYYCARSSEASALLRRLSRGTDLRRWHGGRRSSALPTAVAHVLLLATAVTAPHEAVSDGESPVEGWRERSARRFSIENSLPSPWLGMWNRTLLGDAAETQAASGERYRHQ